MCRREAKTLVALAQGQFGQWRWSYPRETRGSSLLESLRLGPRWTVESLQRRVEGQTIPDALCGIWRDRAAV